MSTITQPASPPADTDARELSPCEPVVTFARCASVIPDVQRTVTAPSQFTAVDAQQLQFQLDDTLSNTA